MHGQRIQRGLLILKLEIHFTVTTHQSHLQITQGHFEGISFCSRTVFVALSIFNCSPPKLFDLVGTELQVNVVAYAKVLYQSPYYKFGQTWV